MAREPITIDDMIDRLAGNRAYVDCLYVVNKIDTVSLQAAQHFAVMKDTVAVSVTERCGLTYLADAIWAKLGIVRVWTRTPDECDLEMDSCITMKRNRGCTVLDVAATVHKELAQNFRHAIVWGRSARF